MEHHALNMPLFIRDLFANRISAFFAMDVIVSAVVLISFIQSEGKRLGMRLLWLPTIGTLLVGVSLGLPLFCISDNSSSIELPLSNHRRPTAVRTRSIT